MRKAAFPIFIISVLLLMAIFVFNQVRLKPETSKNVQLDSLTFTNTMKWDPELLALANEKVFWLPDWRETIHIPSPPANTSRETKDELALLVTYKKTLRTPKTIAAIYKEVDYSNIRLGDRPISDYMDKAKYPYTSALLTKGFRDITIILLSLKKDYDRVRPNILDSAIDPIIPVPRHPAYPSGHSTQAHYFAYILVKLLPSKTNEILGQADIIAKHREIAGLHYPSDSKAGAMLARQFVDLLLQNKNFQLLLEQAKKEW